MPTTHNFFRQFCCTIYVHIFGKALKHSGGDLGLCSLLMPTPQFKVVYMTLAKFLTSLRSPKMQVSFPAPPLGSPAPSRQSTRSRTSSQRSSHEVLAQPLLGFCCLTEHSFSIFVARSSSFSSTLIADEPRSSDPRPLVRIHVHLLPSQHVTATHTLMTSMWVS